MPIQAKLNAQYAQASALPYIEPNVTARFAPRDLGYLEIGDLGVISEEAAWSLAPETAPLPSLHDIVWGFTPRVDVSESHRGKSWSTRLEPSLADALGDLREARKEADENEFERPSDTALANAERILREMYRIRRMRYEVYPLEDGEVAIDAPGGGSTSVFVSCEPNGSVLCIVNIGGKNRVERYSAAAELPNGFLSQGLHRLVPKRESSG